MRERQYDSEDLLQELLSRYPHLLAGDQIDAAAPRRWLLVSRELGVPDQDGGGGRWSADHLFLDQDGIPTIVEVKRSTDTRIRREVVGQMLDYAANAVAYWPVESIRSRLEARYAGDVASLDQSMADLIGIDGDRDSFWQSVKTNLQAGRVRLVFVGDEIPTELRRVIEFLNNQMDPAEVLAVEIKQYVGEGVKTLIPRVYGITAEARQRKSPSAGEKWQWDADSFFAALATRGIADEARVARTILDWASARQLRIWWGQGKTDGSFYLSVPYLGGRHLLLAVWTYGRVEIQFQHMVDGGGPFADEARRRELADRLRAIAIEIPADRLAKRPSFPITALHDDERLTAFLAILDWMLETIRSGG
ncbi:hypothetical protein KF840_02710 [bacterium]|nr:hypothetical protein [bacterium]